MGLTAYSLPPKATPLKTKSPREKIFNPIYTDYSFVLFILYLLSFSKFGIKVNGSDMKVYTKKGDAGETSLIGGKRVSKGDLRIDSYGTVDELNSWIGLLRDHEEILEPQFKQLIEIQDRLFTIGSLLATQPEGTKMKLPLIYDEDITFLEDAIDEMNEGLPPMRKFVLPGGKKILSHCHIARCVCRRAERLTVAAINEDNNENEQHKKAMKYLNRLSDYLFVLSRKIATDLNINEIQWEPRV